MVVDLVRLDTSLHYGTFGVLRVDKDVFCCTLEPPNFANMNNMSCILSGQYLCCKYWSPTHGDTFEVRHVPNRTNILFHAGNVVEHTEGCIILGQYWGKLRGNRAVLNSGNTFKSFMKTMANIEEFKLTIVECY